MSPQCGLILGFTPAEFIADPELWPRRIHTEDRDAAVARYAEHWRTGEPLRTDYRMITRDDRVVWVHDEAYAAIDAEGRHVSQGLIVDTTDQKRLEAQLLHDALHDPLTGLANRVLFSDHLERALVRRHPRHSTVALLFLDIDDFKVVNDSLGHRAGDQLLIEVGRRIEGSIRAGDVAARQGGDEFTGAPPGRSGRRGGAGRCRARGRAPAPSDRPRRPLTGHRCEHRHRPGRRSRDSRRRPPGPRRCCDVRRQGPGQGTLRRLRPVDARARPEPPGAGRRAAGRHRRRRVRGALPADRGPAHPADRRFRGARALVPPDPRDRASQRLHPTLRSHRADRAPGTAGHGAKPAVSFGSGATRRRAATT